MEGINSPATAGAFNTVQITALDTEGNIKIDYTGTITFSSSDGIAELPDSYTFLVADKGKSEFADEVIFKTSGIHWVEVENPGITGRQENIEVLPAAVDLANNGTLLEILKNNVVADSTEEAEVQLTLLDEFSNPVPDVAVAFSSTGDAEINAASGTTDENGQYSVNLTNTIAEKVNVTAQYDSDDDAIPDKAITNGSPAEITFLSGDAASLVIESGNNQNDIVTQTLDNPLVVKVTDNEGNPVEGESVTFTITDSPEGATGQELTNVDAATDADGFASAEFTLGTKAGSYKIIVGAAGLDDVIFEATAEAGDAAQLAAFVEQPSTSVAGEIIDPEVTVQLLDEFENEVNSDGTVITLSISGAATLGGDVAISTVNGLASFGNLTVAEAGNYTLTAEAENVDSDESDSFTITAGDADAIVMITQPENSIAGETVEGAPKVRVEDDQNNPLSDIEVSVTLSSGDFTGTSTIKVITGENGEAEFDNLIINKAGEDYTLTFKVAGVIDLKSDELDVTNAGLFTDNSSLTSNPTSLAAGGNSQVTVVLADEFGNAVSGVTDFEVALGESDAEIEEAISESEIAGTYTFTVTNAKAEEITVTVTANDIEIGDAEIKFTTGGISASNSEVTATSPHTADGEDASTITITLKDANGNTIRGVEEGDFILTYGDHAELSEFIEAGDGVYTYDLTNTKAEELAITVTVDGIELDKKPEILFQTGAISAANSSVNADPDTVIANGTDASVLSISLIDDLGNPVSGEADNISLSGLGDATAGEVKETEVQGIYIADINSTKSEAIVVSVSVNGIELNVKPTITFVSGPFSSANSEIQAMPDTLSIRENSTIKVTLRDVNNNLITNREDSLSLTLSGDATIVNTFAETEAGIYEVLITNTIVERITATVGEKIGSVVGEVEVLFTAGQGANLAIHSGNEQSGEVAQKLENPLVVKITDADENPVPGTDVNFTISQMPADSTNAELLNIKAFTDSSGLASAELQLGFKAGTYQVTVNYEGLGNVIFEAEAEAAEAFAGNTTAIVPNGKVADTTFITIKVSDAFENPVAGVASLLNISLGGVNTGSDLAEIIDLGNGTYTSSYVPMKPGDDEFVFTLNEESISGNPYISSVSAGDLKSLVKVSGDDQTQVVTTILDDSLVVRVLDVNDLPIPGKEVKFTVTSSPLDAEMQALAEESVISNSDGFAGTQFKLGNKSGEYIISALVDTLNPIQFNFNATAGAVTNFAVVGGNNQEQRTLSTLKDSLTVGMFDQYENPVINEPIAFSLDDYPEFAEESEFFPDTAYSNSSGIASTAFKLGDTGGIYEITAKAYRQQIDNLYFVASAIPGNTNPTILDTVNTVVFDGSMDTFMYAEPSQTLDSLENYTLEIWVLPKSVEGYYELFKKADENNGQFKVTGQNNEIDATVYLEGGEELTISAGNIFEVDETAGGVFKSVDEDSVVYKWTHLAFTVDNDNKRVNLYRNGFRMANADFEGDVRRSQARLEMGRGLDGEIHEVRVWDKTNSRNEIQSRMTQIMEGNEDHLVLYHTFDDQGDVAGDLTGNDNDLHLSNGVIRIFSIRGIPVIEMFENEEYIMAFKAKD
ncbi:MAG: invasin domain 3-containing protein, partial [Balneolaceae bacterium]